MPAKKNQISDEERAKRIRETAREIGTSNNATAFNRAFAKVVKPVAEPPKEAKPKK